MSETESPHVVISTQHYWRGRKLYARIRVTCGKYGRVCFFRFRVDEPAETVDTDCDLCGARLVFNIADLGITEASKA